eukprot:TRINITY_DN101843_c0_g1_i1.p1 TRINITY_DN101843_c0_g1~~TRINITY_DN101843_c0_g1_i1.p1  ORF type:complete len:324 (-),score=82.13 TRINITY_DN101843_c0_g1_i1:95-1066(-)
MAQPLFLRDSEYGQQLPLQPGATPAAPPSSAVSAQDTSMGVGTTAYRGLCHAAGELVKVLCCPFAPCGCGPVVVVHQGYVGVMTRFGIFERVLPPGMYAINTLTQKVDKVCMKMQSWEVPRQSAMTHDNLSVTIDAVTFVTVIDPVRATFQVDDYKHAVKVLAASTLLRIVAEHDLQQIFVERQKISERLTQTMQEKTGGWGLQVAGVELRDITIPDSMQRAMAQVAEANREADAKVIVAEGQRRSSHIFVQAAEAMEKQPMSLQLQWFETLRQISAEKSSTVIVPDSVIGSLGDLARKARQDPSGATGSGGSGGDWTLPSRA